jgi:hypothetical protein
MWAVWFVSMDQRLYINAGRDWCASSRKALAHKTGSMTGVSFTVLYGLRFFGNDVHQTDDS